ncbi:hypothetical protein CLOM_g18095, partial [Closterium sp. NIES-68]
LVRDERRGGALPAEAQSPAQSAPAFLLKPCVSASAAGKRFLPAKAAAAGADAAQRATAAAQRIREGSGRQRCEA